VALRYDYVIVGAGSAGCVLANKLSADPAATVLLLEAGPKPRSKEIRIPAAFSKLMKSKFDWDYETTPQEALDGRRIYVPRGKTLGGSSAMNAQMHIPGHPADFDAWPESWGWEQMKPYLDGFEKESCSVSEQRAPNPMTTAFVEAAEAAGIATRGDLRPETLAGVGITRVHQRKGLRCTAADAWLKPARRRDNLTVVTDTQVLGIDFDGKRAARVRHTGGEVEIGRELILSAGAIGSPHLLLLSGVGPGGEVHDLPDVGHNLRDHPMAIMLWNASGKESLFAAEKPAQLVKLLLQRRGMLTSNVGEAAAFVASREGLDAPDIELIFAPVLYLDEGLTEPDRHGFSVGVVALQPQSVGSVTLRSTDPLAPPDIDYALLSDPDDLRVLAEGVRQARRVAATPPLMDIAEEERAPGSEDVESWIRANLQTVYHPVGTCALGKVVDDELRVKGLEGIRVVDGSVIPNLMRGHPHAQISMVALRAAETINASNGDGARSLQAAP
jgi:choline dehydrogenase-like flavoprotein